MRNLSSYSAAHDMSSFSRLQSFAVLGRDCRIQTCDHLLPKQVCYRYTKSLYPTALTRGETVYLYMRNEKNYYFPLLFLRNMKESNFRPPRHIVWCSTTKLMFQNFQKLTALTSGEYHVEMFINLLNQ